MTIEEKNELKAAVLQELQAESQDVGELQPVDTLDGLQSLPALRGKELVSAPVSLLSKPAQDAAAAAETAVKDAINKAEVSTQDAIAKADSAVKDAVGRAEAATQEAKAKTDAAAKKATDAAAKAEAATSSAQSAAELATEAAGKAEKSANAADAAAERAEAVEAGYHELATHARNGVTARFDGFVDNVTLAQMSVMTVDGVYFDISRKSFVGKTGANYVNNWGGADLFMNADRTEMLKDKVYLLEDVPYVWSSEEGTLVETGGRGGGNTYNVTTEVPLESGFYTLETAIKAVAVKLRAKGRCVTFESSHGKWETSQFVGTSLDSWENPESWDDSSGGGKVKSVTLNGVKHDPNDAGDISLAVEVPEVDASLDSESTNAIQNGVVAAKLSELEAHTLGSIEVVPDGDDNYLYAYDMKGVAIGAPAKLPAGGGGGGTSSASRIVVTANVAPELVKEGGSALLTWTYDHVNSEGNSDGVNATVKITVKLGTTTLWTQELRNVSRGTYTADLSAYMSVAGNVDVYVAAECTSAEGERQSKQAYAKVTVVGIKLTSDYDMGTALQKGGYQNGDTINIPFTLTGSGRRTVSMYLDGSSTPTTKDVSKAGTTRDSFVIPASSLSAGRHTVQMVAERDGIKSDAIWIDFLKGGGQHAWVGMKYASKSGEVVLGEMPLTARLSARQYGTLEFDYAAYDPASVPAIVTETQASSDKQTTKIYSVGRGRQTYMERFMEQGETRLRLECGLSALQAVVNVEPSGLDIGEATQGLELKLNAAGRSNSESPEAREQWTHGEYGTTFEGVDWQTSGWDGEALVLKNGAKATIDFKPFVSDVKRGGMSVEIDMEVSNVSDRKSVIVDCMENDAKGFRITADSAMLYSGSTKDQTDEENKDPDTGLPIVTKTPVGVKQNYAESKRVRFAFNVGKRSDGSLMELYMNGDRVSAMCYQEDDNFKQDTPQGITISSDGADVRVHKVYAYSRPLTDDEVVDNHTVGSDTPEEMAKRFSFNNVINPETGEIDLDKIVAKGKCVVKIVRTEDSGRGLDDVNACKNKKQNFHVDELVIYTPWGDVVRFTNIIMRIQGTSSTKYPVKNYRFYWMKCMKAGLKPEMWINGVKQEVNKLPLFKGDTKPCKVSCAKADFSDSSMKTNTGIAIVFNDVMKEISPTPPQQQDPTIRTAIYGYPCDIFATTSADDSNPTYYGQYQMNNDKSDWYDVMGLTDKEKHIAIESLDNGKKLCNFQVDDDLDAQLDAEFESSLEFNYPKDTLWSGADEAAGEKNASDYQKGAVKKLWSWVKSCVPAGADMTCRDLSTWKSEKFKEELSLHRDVRNTTCYYLFMVYGGNVDQFVKNTIQCTWDGEIWWYVYYDGDTSYGKRNDSLLAYGYNIMRDSWDAEKKKWVFEGHDSWFWCLLLANFEEEIKAMAEELRRVMTNQKVKGTFETIQNNWSAREYNKSGEMKYIKPETKGVRVTENGVTTDGNKYYYMYALSGTREMQLDHFITNRFALLDAKYGVSTYRADSAGFYMAREVSDPADVMRIVSGDEYYYAYGLSGKDYMEGETGRLLRGETGSLSVTGKRALNDPMLLFGASKILELDLTDAASHLLNGLELGNCKMMRRLDISVKAGGQPSTTTWWLVTQGCRQLQEVSLHGQTMARSNRQDSTTLDFSTNTLLRRLDAGGTNVKSVTVAKGAPIEQLVLPASLTTLRLEYLPKLTDSGLRLEGTSNVTKLIVDSCPGIDWQTLFERCSNIEYLRVTGIDMEGDGSLLSSLMRTGGVDEEGGNVETCRLVGTYRLTKYKGDEEYEALQAHFPELNIVQPEYTMLESDESVADDANISNLDNQTGYKFGNDYKVSGHIATILKNRHRVLAKVTKKATTREVNMAGVETVVNNLDGEMTYFPLNDADSYKYADGSAAKLDGSEGDWMMLENFFWCKGINDFLNSKNYSCYSSKDKDHMPPLPDVEVLTLEDIKALPGGYINGKKVMTGRETLKEAYSTDSSYSVCMVDVSRHKRVRWPSVPGTSLVGSAFTDDAGKVVKNIIVPTLGNRFEAGMYLVSDVPDGATALHFSILNSAEFDKVVLSNSMKIEDMEPEWFASDEHLCAVVGSSVVGSKLRACITGGSTTASMTWTDFHYYSVQRGMQQIDALMHFRIANLSYAKYGRRDMQEQCGAGQHNNTRTTGGTASRGMQDTIGFEEAHSINENVTSSLIDDGRVHQYAWYRSVDEYGAPKVTQVNNICCLGYEDIIGHKYEMMDNVDLPNTSGNVGKWRIWMPDGSTVMIKGSTNSGYWITSVAHGKLMAVIPVGSMNGSSSTYYSDMYYFGSSPGRVVYRGCYYANAYGGVSFAYASYDASDASTGVGSRLAFRGKIVRAQSVAAYKALVEKA